MRRILKWLAIAIVGVALGLGSAALAVTQVVKRSGLHVGAWSTPLDAGGADRGFYTRAAVAVGALLALNRSETIYFFADSDDEGRALDANCTYTLEGRDPAARWWSITLYAGDHFLIENAQNRWSYNGANVARAADGRFHIKVAKAEQPGDWLPTGQAESLVLVVRLYNPAAEIAADPAKAALPSISRGECRS
ncbi:DUF1214 domain-containing protein [Oleomonas cavernae]|uniref:DUF1214 domain-containing protein n=1 Tax=Oleomonas cavernae TaxID=2320859 RepID=A0A418WC37_9PROT|nr:DUF1214 domain-containing protein [Oleomonas cavernae]RJF87570.1 DUF1214 domain-containing protein [Oleomonas cavernae]